MLVIALHMKKVTKEDNTIFVKSTFLMYSIQIYIFQVFNTQKEISGCKIVKNIIYLIIRLCETSKISIIVI